MLIRASIPHETKRILVVLTDFLSNLAEARYIVLILSPDGDRADCYRHYEAIAFGAVPITELDPFLYRHLSHGPAVFSHGLIPKIGT